MKPMQHPMKRPVRYKTMEQTQLTDANIQKELLWEYKQNSKNKSQEYTKFLADKKSLIKTLFGQCDKSIQTKITLRANYTEDRDAWRLLAYIEGMRTVRFDSDDCAYHMGCINKL